MAGNTIGKTFCVTAFGESHGPGIGCVIDGCPPGLDIAVSDFERDLSRRKTGSSRYTSQRKERDEVEILSGVFEGKSTGTPIALYIKNEDQKPKDYEDIKDLFRPGHGDYTYFKKYGHRDWRGGGRTSARITTAFVAAGVVAKQLLFNKNKIEVKAYLSQMGNLTIDTSNFSWGTVEQNPFFCPDNNLVPKLEEKIQSLLKEGDSIGARINVVANNIPTGLGEPVFERLDGDLAAALMNINAVKGIEIGDGFACVLQKGSEHRDEITSKGFLSNHAGGILAGISSGQDIKASVAFKPTSSIRLPGKTIDTQGNDQEVVTKGRHDPCVGLRAVPIVEAMVALVLADHMLRSEKLN